MNFAGLFSWRKKQNVVDFCEEVFKKKESGSQDWEPGKNDFVKFARTRNKMVTFLHLVVNAKQWQGKFQK